MPVGPRLQRVGLLQTGDEFPKSSFPEIPSDLWQELEDHQTKKRRSYARNSIGSLSRGLVNLVLDVLFGREFGFDVAFHGTVAAVVFIGLIG